MLTIEVKLNGQLIGKAVAANQSDLANYSDYKVQGHESGCESTGVEAIDTTWEIHAHRRKQSAWALVEKVAAAMRMFQGERG